jgi:hypothetical protein
MIWITLPEDIIFGLISFLSLRDIISFSSSAKHLRAAVNPGLLMLNIIECSSFLIQASLKRWSYGKN